MTDAWSIFKVFLATDLIKECLATSFTKSKMPCPCCALLLLLLTRGAAHCVQVLLIIICGRSSDLLILLYRAIKVLPLGNVTLLGVTSFTIT